MTNPQASLQFLSKDLGPHKYGCLMALLPEKLQKAISNWAMENIPEFHLGPGGYEYHSHITIKYGFKNGDQETVQKLKALLARNGPLQIDLKGLSLFTGGYGKWINEDGDVLKIDVESGQLRELNVLISETFDCEDKFPDYHPHITVAYLDPKVSHLYVTPEMQTSFLTKLNTPLGMKALPPVPSPPPVPGSMGQGQSGQPKKGAHRMIDSLGRNRCFDQQGKPIGCPPQAEEQVPTPQEGTEQATEKVGPPQPPQSGMGVSDFENWQEDQTGGGSDFSDPILANMTSKYGEPFGEYFDTNSSRIELFENNAGGLDPFKLERDFLKWSQTSENSIPFDRETWGIIEPTKGEPKEITPKGSWMHSPEATHAHLSHEEVSDVRDMGGGLNETFLVTTKGGAKGVFKPEIGAIGRTQLGDKPNLSKREAATWHLANTLGMGDYVPPTGIRQVQGQIGSVQQYIDNAHPPLVTKTGGLQDPNHVAKAGAFDFVLGNLDRHMNNWLVKDNETPVLIDNGLTFPSEDSFKRRGLFGFRSYFTDAAAHRNLPIPKEVRQWAKKKEEVEKTLQKQGLPEDQIEGTLKRLNDVANSKTFGDLYKSYDMEIHPSVIRGLDQFEGHLEQTNPEPGRARR